MEPAMADEYQDDGEPEKAIMINMSDMKMCQHMTKTATKPKETKANEGNASTEKPGEAKELRAAQGAPGDGEYRENMEDRDTEAETHPRGLCKGGWYDP